MLRVSATTAFRDNYIWLIHAPADESKVVAVDPGQAPPVEQSLQADGLELAAIFATHHHFDHVGGIEALCRDRPVPVFGPAGEHVPGRTDALGEGDTAQMAALGLNFRVLDIPGHTAGHIAFAGHGAVFCGDTLFSAGCGRLFEGTPGQMVSSLAKLAALDDDTQVYCGHEYTLDNLRFALTVDPGNREAADYREACRKNREAGAPTLPSTIAMEKTVNPFLRCDQDGVKNGVSRHTGRELADTVEVFAALRSWKDSF